MIEVHTHKASDEQRPSESLSQMVQADATNKPPPLLASADDSAKAASKPPVNDSVSYHFGSLNLFERAEEGLSHISHSIKDEVSPVSISIGHVLHNSSDVVQALGKGAYDSAVAPVVHGLAAAGEWVVHNPVKALEIGGAVGALAAVEIYSGGLATEAVLSALPTVIKAAAAATPYVTTVGSLYAAGVTIEAGVKVARHGELGTIMSQNGHETPEELARVEVAKAQLAKDTGRAVVSDLSLILGGAVSKLVSRGNAEVVDEATALVLVEQMGDSAIKTGIVAARAFNDLGTGAYQVTDGASRIWGDAQSFLTADSADAATPAHYPDSGSAPEPGSAPGSRSPSDSSATPASNATPAPGASPASDSTLASTISKQN